MAKKLAILVLVLFLIISTRQENDEGFLWVATLLHIILARLATQNIKNKPLRALAFIGVMSMLLLSLGVMKSATSSFLIEINTLSTQRIEDIFTKSFRAIAELVYRVYHSEWRRFNPSETLRRAVFGAGITIAILSLLFEGAKKTLTAQKGGKLEGQTRTG